MGIFLCKDEMKPHTYIAIIQGLITLILLIGLRVALKSEAKWEPLIWLLCAGSMVVFAIWQENPDPNKRK